MMKYTKKAERILSFNKREITSFIMHDKESNIDWETVNSFGEEWKKFSYFSEDEINAIGNEYFDIVDEVMLNKNTVALDAGCGTGRWTDYAAKKAKFVEAIDPSDAVFSAMNLLQNNKNVRITQAEISNLPFEDDSFDFVFSLGVLHHIPDTQSAMKSCVNKIKKGGFFLVYLYYNLDNKGALIKSIFRFSNFLRKIICKMPHKLKHFICDLLAVFIYYPLILLAKIFKILFKPNLYKKLPLSWYHDKSWNVVRNDALDRFGTPIEQRFSKHEIKNMMMSCGLSNIVFSNKEPFWHAVGQKKI